MTQFKPRYLVYGFTGYSTIQLIGYLGTAYKFLEQPMFLLTMILILIVIVLGVLNWAKEQSKQNHELSKARLLSSLSGSIVLIVLILFALFVGSWIAI
jgi:uncharacterized membrane protein YjgN (DUF898 family)